VQTHATFWSNNEESTWPFSPLIRAQFFEKARLSGHENPRVYYWGSSVSRSPGICAPIAVSQEGPKTLILVMDLGEFFIRRVGPVHVLSEQDKAPMQHATNGSPTRIAFHRAL
jgi:hypothetical protein